MSVPPWGSSSAHMCALGGRRWGVKPRPQWGGRAEASHLPRALRTRQSRSQLVRPRCPIWHANGGAWVSLHRARRLAVPDPRRGRGRRLALPDRGTCGGRRPRHPAAAGPGVGASEGACRVGTRKRAGKPPSGLGALRSSPPDRSRRAADLALSGRGPVSTVVRHRSGGPRRDITAPHSIHLFEFDAGSSDEVDDRTRYQHLARPRRRRHRYGPRCQRCQGQPTSISPVLIAARTSSPNGWRAAGNALAQRIARSGPSIVVDGANWHRRRLPIPPVTTVRDQMGRGHSR